jgi:hypothetical protein
MMMSPLRRPTYAETPALPRFAAARNRRQAVVSAPPGFRALRSAKSFSEFKFLSFLKIRFFLRKIPD